MKRPTRGVIARNDQEGVEEDLEFVPHGGPFRYLERERCTRCIDR